MPLDTITDLQAVIIATGETGKLYPLTEQFPSPMIPVANQPVMVYAIELLVRHGIEKGYVSVHHLAANVESYFLEGYRWGLELKYILQRDALGTGGSIKLAQPWLTDTFIVLPADVILDLDIAAALEQHRATGSVVTVIAQAGDQESGAAILEPEVFDFIPARTRFDILTDLLPLLEGAGLNVSRFVTQSFFNPLHSFQEYKTAQETFLHDQENLTHLSLPTREIAPGIWSGRKTIIDSDARLTPPVLLGQNCHVGRGVELGPDAVIGSNVFIDDDATISQSTVLDGTYVGRLVNLQNRVVSGDLVIDVISGDHVAVEDDFILSNYEESVQLSLRRVFDASVAIALLLLLSPFLLVLGLMAWITTGSALLRVDFASPGSKGSHFSLWQFNTGREYPSNWFGRWMGAWELNRLPELWNVVTGELRLVGEKALLPNEVFVANHEAWDRMQEDYAPGFTGLWYVETGNDAELLEVLVTDAYYMATRSTLSDLKLLVRTPVSWARRTLGKEQRVKRQDVGRRDGNLVEYDR